MIDAYEIGIQLLLQDDVSAGLAVIEKELAEVDRGIAVTTANLVKLTQNAERASQAVAGVGGNKATIIGSQATAEVSEADRPATEVPNGKAESEAPSSAPLPQSGPDARSEPASKPPTAKAEQDAAEVQPRVDVSSWVPPRSDAPPADPPRVTNTGVELDDKKGTASEATPRAVAPLAAAVEPLVVDPPSRAIEQSRLPAAAPVSSGQQETVRLVSPSKVTAAVHHADRDRRGIVEAGKSAVAIPTLHRSERATAPERRAETRRAELTMPDVNSTASVGAGAQQSVSSEMSGMVLLDGHLVGRWLSDMMARDASRPPSGTSFFDPRQTPAWHNSGAL